MSFEFALSFHGLIPEAVHSYTSATFEKKKKKKYVTPLGTFTYRDVPSSAYAYGVDIIKDPNQFYKIASAEKALCDQLYKTKSVGNYRELRELLFDDLRIDETKFAELNADDISELALLYGSTNVKKLSLMMGRQSKLTVRRAGSLKPSSQRYHSRRSEEDASASPITWF